MTTFYRCPNCDDLYDEEWDAQSCCDADRVYRCDLCEEYYDDEDDAGNCKCSQKSKAEDLEQDEFPEVLKWRTSKTLYSIGDYKVVLYHNGQCGLLRYGKVVNVWLSVEAANEWVKCYKKAAKVATP